MSHDLHYRSRNRVLRRSDRYRDTSSAGYVGSLSSGNPPRISRLDCPAGRMGIGLRERSLGCAIQSGVTVMTTYRFNGPLDSHVTFYDFGKSTYQPGVLLATPMAAMYVSRSETAKFMRQARRSGATVHIERSAKS